MNVVINGVNQEVAVPIFEDVNKAITTLGAARLLKLLNAGIESYTLELVQWLSRRPRKGEPTPAADIAAAASAAIPGTDFRTLALLTKRIEALRAEGLDVTSLSEQRRQIEEGEIA